MVKPIPLNTEHEFDFGEMNDGMCETHLEGFFKMSK